MRYADLVQVNIQEAIRLHEAGGQHRQFNPSMLVAC
jgi:hypothetical protein